MPTFQCPKCELLFAAQGELDWHVRDDHRARDEPIRAQDGPEPSDQAAGSVQGVSAGGSQPGAARRARWWAPWRRSP
jgi:hypothetical protein